jgi:hypothetical protein
MGAAGKSVANILADITGAEKAQQSNRAQTLPADRKSARFDVSKSSPHSGHTPYVGLPPVVTSLLNRCLKKRANSAQNSGAWFFGSLSSASQIAAPPRRPARRSLRRRVCLSRRSFQLVVGDSGVAEGAVGVQFDGAGAIELVANQLYTNACGLPKHPVTHLVEGKWIEGSTLENGRKRWGG